MLLSQRLFTLLTATLAVANAALAQSASDQWPQWRGPLGTGVAPKANPPVKWSEESGVKWKVKLPGRGTSTPIVWDNTIFLQTAIPTGKKIASIPVDISPTVPAAQVDPGQRPRRGGGGGGGFGQSEKPTEEHQFVLLAVDRDSGKIRWQKVARQEVPHESHHQDHSFASSSPVTDGKSIFAYFGSRGLHAFDMEGNAKWSKDLGRMQTKMSFGEASSPALYRDTLVISWDHEGDDFVAAFNKNTGEELWRTPREEDTSWSTPLIVEHQGKAQVITSATRKIRSYDLQTGKLIWECGGMTVNAIPTPVTDGDLVYLMSGFRGNALLAIQLGRSGDLTGTDAIVWQHNKSTPYVPSPLLYKGRLYFLAGNNGMLSAFDAKTGKAFYEAERLESIQGVYASPVAAADRIYLVSRNGTTVVLNASEKIEVLATNRLEDNFDSTPALVGNQIILRGRENLYCLAN